MECDWIICERTGRWAAALRQTLESDAAPRARKRRLREVRSLVELTSNVSARSLALVEVRRANLAEVLSWLADARSAHPRIRVVALLDHDTFDDASRHLVADAIRAAGAVELTDSPRRLHDVTAVARRHAVASARVSKGPDEHESLSDWAWSLLPWQPA